MKQTITVNKIRGDVFDILFNRLFTINVYQNGNGTCVADCSYLGISSNLTGKIYTNIDNAVDDFQKEIAYTIERNINKYQSHIRAMTRF